MGELKAPVDELAVLGSCVRSISKLRTMEERRRVLAYLDAKFKILIGEEENPLEKVNGSRVDEDFDDDTLVTTTTTTTAPSIVKNAGHSGPLTSDMSQ